MTSTSRGALDAAALELLALQVRTGLGAVQRVQVEYDKSMWDIDDPVFANLRHIQLHLSITVGKLAKLIEPRDHDTFHGRQVPEIASDDIAPIIADWRQQLSFTTKMLKPGPSVRKPSASHSTAVSKSASCASMRPEVRSFH